MERHEDGSTRYHEDLCPMCRSANDVVRAGIQDENCWVRSWWCIEDEVDFWNLDEALPSYEAGLFDRFERQDRMEDKNIREFGDFT